MERTMENVSQFVGGQMEIQHPVNKFAFRGEIATITIKGYILRVRFAWLGKAENFHAHSTLPVTWVNEDKLDYEADISQYSFVANHLGNMTYVHFPNGGIVTFYLPEDESNLDPNNVEGLRLKT